MKNVILNKSKTLAVLTVLCACDLCQDAEGPGLRRPRARVPILCVLDQTLLTVIAERRHVVHLHLYDGFPCGPETNTEVQKVHQTDTSRQYVNHTQ